METLKKIKKACLVTLAIIAFSLTANASFTYDFNGAPIGAGVYEITINSTGAVVGVTVEGDGEKATATGTEATGLAKCKKGKRYLVHVTGNGTIQVLREIIV